MKENDVYLLRQMRREIIEICKDICIGKRETVDNYWYELESKLTGINSFKLANEDIIEECRVCIAQKNYLRLYDLLRYEIDTDISAGLSGLSEEDRMCLTEKARIKNEEAMNIYHKNIYTSIQNVRKPDRIVYSYTGTENVSIFVREKEYQYRLFSSENPWMESVGFVDKIEEDKLDEIYVLGFGGGYLIRELERRFKETKIKVYLPNKDIFKAVIDSLPVYDILKNKYLELHFDATCLIFFMRIQESIEQNRNFTFYIDKQELRALTGSWAWTKKLIQENGSKERINALKENVIEDLVGTKIEKYVKNLIIND